MNRLLVISLVAVSLGGCSFLPGGGGSSDGPRAARGGATSRPARWEYAKVSYFSTQTGGMLRQQRSKLTVDTPFGTGSGPTYFAVVSKNWVWRDRRQAVEEGARVMAYTTNKNLRLDEPFEQVKKPNIKRVEDDVIVRLVEQLEEQGFFDMPPARDLAIREDGRGGYVLPRGRAWLMVQMDDWRKTVAMDDLRAEQMEAYTGMKNAVAGVFSAAVAPMTSVVMEPVDLKALGKLRPGAVQEPTPDAEVTEDGRARYQNASKSDPRWWEKEPERKDDLEDFLRPNR